MLDKFFTTLPLATLSLLSTGNLFSSDLSSRVSDLEGKVSAIEEKNVRGTLQPKTVTARPEVDETRLFITADFLIWRADQDGLEFGIKNSLPITSEGIIGTIHDLSYDWNVGLRVGLGYNLPYDMWDLFLDWTSFHNTTKNGVSFSGDGYVKGIWTPNIGAGTNFQDFFFGDAHWKLAYDTMDLELGRHFFTSRTLSLRPHFGLRGARIEEHLTLNFSGDQGLTGLQPIFVKGDNDFHALGLRAGLNMFLHLNSQWSFFGKASGSVLYGRYHVTSFIQGEFTDTPLVNIKNGFHRVRSNLETGAGVQWESYVNRNRAHLIFALGYEFIQWFNQIHMRNYQNTDIGFYLESHGDLGLNGVTFSARIDF